MQEHLCDKPWGYVAEMCNSIVAVVLYRDKNINFVGPKHYKLTLKSIRGHFYPKNGRDDEKS